MSFRDFPSEDQAVNLLQNSLRRGRLGHAYLFSGPDAEPLEEVAMTLAKTLSCTDRTDGTDSCDKCSPCVRIHECKHPDVFWVRPESKSRVITIDQIRDLMQMVQLKPMEARVKVGIIVAVDRLNIAAANAFLKTLEEPPAHSVLILTTTEPQQVLETILSRCLRLKFSPVGIMTPAEPWLADFSQIAAAHPSPPLLRYKLLGILGKELAAKKEDVEARLSARSPLETYNDVDPKLREKWEDELTAAVEGEYRRTRQATLNSLQSWLRDVWLTTLSRQTEMLRYPQLAETTAAVASRMKTEAAQKNLEVLERTQKLLHTNVQEALILEVGLLNLEFSSN